VIAGQGLFKSRLAGKTGIDEGQYISPATKDNLMYLCNLVNEANLDLKPSQLNPAHRAFSIL
jgi:hypothetical protein